MRYVIVGGSAAAISAIEAIRSVDSASSIDLFSDEKTPLFSRVLLPYYIAEQLTKPLLNFRSADFFEKQGVTPHMGVRVREVSSGSNTIETDDGARYPFDRLLLATGGKPHVPPIPGIDKKGVSTLKTMEDAERIYRLPGKRALVIGAGTIGVEAAISLRRRGLSVSLLEKLGHILPTLFDEEAASLVRKRIEALGIEVFAGERAVQLKGNGQVKGVVTDRREIDCDMVVFAVGIEPAVELAQEAGIEIGSKGGIKVDPQMKTSVTDIYAAGDVVETFDISRNANYMNAIWPCACEQGRIAGLNMAGKKTLYGGSFRINSIGNFIGIPAISMGVIHAEACEEYASGYNFQEIKKRTKDSYWKLVLREGCVIGAIMVGQTRKAGLITMLLKKKIDVSDSIPLLLSDNLNFIDLLPLLRLNADKFPEPEYKELMDTGL